MSGSTSTGTAACGPDLGPWPFVPIVRIGAAIATDEYVPTKTPKSIANAKPWIPSPPSTYSVPTASNVVPEVSTVRLIVWLIESLMISGVARLNRPRFSRIRSNTTIVSFKE